MATITPTLMTGSGKRAMVEVDLTGTADTFAYIASYKPTLIMRNDSGGPLSPVIDGDGGSVVPVAGVGDVDVSGGYAVGSIADGAVVAIPLNTISAFLTGTIAITGGTGLTCSLLHF